MNICVYIYNTYIYICINKYGNIQLFTNKICIYNVPVPIRHIMISLYCWHSNLNISFRIKNGSEQNMKSLKTIYIRGRPSMIPHYAETAFMETRPLLFSHMYFTQEKLSHAFNIYHENFTTIEMFTRTITYLHKNNMENLSRFFPPKILTEFFHIITKSNAFITHSSVIL